MTTLKIIFFLIVAPILGGLLMGLMKETFFGGESGEPKDPAWGIKREKREHRQV